MSPFEIKQYYVCICDDEDDDNGDYNDNDVFNAVACLHLDMQGK